MMRFDDLEEALMTICELGAELAADYVMINRANAPPDTVVAFPGTEPPPPPASRFEIRAQVHDLLHGPLAWRANRQVSTWENEAIEKLVELAAAEPEASNRYEERTRCPLCRGQPQDAYVGGFTLPLGLERHLSGRGRALQCPVMMAARQLIFLRRKQS